MKRETAFLSALACPVPNWRARACKSGKRSKFEARADWRDPKSYPTKAASHAKLAEEFASRYSGRKPFAYFPIGLVEREQKKVTEQDRASIALLDWPVVCMPPIVVDQERPGEKFIYLQFNVANELKPQLKRAKVILASQQDHYFPKGTRVQGNAKLVKYLRLLDAYCSSPRAFQHAAEFFFPGLDPKQQPDSARECVEAAKTICVEGLVRPRSPRGK